MPIKGTNPVIYLKDYNIPVYEVNSYELNFDLYEDETLVTTIAEYYKNNNSSENGLVLHGEDVELISIILNDKELTEDDYIIENNMLILGKSHLGNEYSKSTSYGANIHSLPEKFELKIITKIHPETNTTLEGLYKSKGKFCTQCETHGFRRMTYFQDRPDVMTFFTVRITADKELYPVLLSNGNKIEEGDLENNRHFTVWEDPFKKPCYLFALVAGKLDYNEDSFTTMSGKKVVLRIFTETHNIHKTPFAMESLKKSMKWDEERYGLEYDLDIFMIVAVDDFNSGAMENKGLNIFNSSCVFATKETATDKDFIRVEKVIAHEYFHNWTGDRVTCRDWFQLSLKEGLTVYRDHEFTCDTHSRGVARIESVKLLRNYQFKEDAGPMRHSIRPTSFEEISNFYTMTVYEKGAEVIGMYETVLGRDGFRKGMDLYFKRHDGQAVTTEDFLAAMRDANREELQSQNINLNQMQVWYDQSGTPIVDVVGAYDVNKKTYTLLFRQHCKQSPEVKNKKPFLIPIKYSLFNKETGETIGEKERIFILDTEETRLVISGIHAEPIPSLLRSFSAPIKLNFGYHSEDYEFLAQYETDDFNQFEAVQKFSKEVLIELISIGTTEYTPRLLSIYSHILQNKTLDNSFKAETLVLPTEEELIDIIGTDVNPQHIHTTRINLEKEIAIFLEGDFIKIYEELILQERTKETYNISTKSVGNRKMKNISLKYLTIASGHNTLAYDQFIQSTNMTDEMGALQSIVLINNELRKKALADFYTKWKDDANVVDKWFMLQASSPLKNMLQEIKDLINHELFEITNPNKVRSVLNTFANLNPYHFHSEDGMGYEFISDKVIELNKINPMIAARLVKSLINWKILEPTRSKLLKLQLERINKEDLSPDVGEVVRKSLQD